MKNSPCRQNIEEKIQTILQRVKRREYKKETAPFLAEMGEEKEWEHEDEAIFGYIKDAALRFRKQEKPTERSRKRIQSTTCHDKLQKPEMCREPLCAQGGEGTSAQERGGYSGGQLGGRARKNQSRSLYLSLGSDSGTQRGRWNWKGYWGFTEKLWHKRQLTVWAKPRRCPLHETQEKQWPRLRLSKQHRTEVLKKKKTDTVRKDFLWS